MAKRKPRTRLRHVKTAEVSIVDRAANKRRFLLTKNEEGADMPQDNENSLLSPVMLDLIDTEVTGEDKMEELFKSLDPEATNAVRGAMRMLQSFRDDLPQDVLSHIAKAGDFPEFMKEKTKKRKEKMAKNQDGDTPAKDTPKVDDLPQEAQVLFKAQNDKLEEMQKSLVETQDINKSLATQLREERDARLNREYVAKAEGYASLPGVKADEFGLVLKSLADKAPEEVEKIETVLKAAVEVISKSDAFSEVGTDGATGGATSWDRVEASARELVQKGEFTTMPEAIDHLLVKDPTLYDAYNREKAN